MKAIQFTCPFYCEIICSVSDNLETFPYFMIMGFKLGLQREAADRDMR